ncbi:MAG TPA: deoxyribonuclease [Archaeoglobaceae archaeon]|nr:deoxyribonuclease [Archaeoglobaceae archaeon]
MKCFDAHIHSEGRSAEDLAFMAENGIKVVVTCAFYPIRPKYQETMIDLFRKLTEFERRRGKKAGMELFAAIGIHPRCIPSSYDKILDFMEHDTKSVAFGEIGLEEGNEKEIEVLVEQLKLAKEIDRCCIVHTPRRNKTEITEKTVEILERIGFPERRVIIDHVSLGTVEFILRKGYYAGLTVEEGKLSIDEVIQIVETYGFDYFVLNSDTGFSPSEKVLVVKAAQKLEEKFGNGARKVYWDNAVEFFGI